MAHFAEIDQNNEVLRVIVVANKDCGDLSFPQSEIVGQAFIASMGIDGVWKQTSYNNSFRRHYAGIGSMYISDADVFTQVKPYDSWTLNSNNEWVAPVARPSADGYWEWNETQQKWKR